MADTAKKNEDCHKSTLQRLQAAFSTLGSVLWKILCPQFKALIESIKALFQAQIAVLEPILMLEDTFLQNFVIFPADAVAKSLGGISDVSAKLRNFGLDSSCGSQKKMFDEVDKTTGPLRSAAKFFSEASANAKKEIEANDARVAYLHEFVDKVAADFLDLKCQ
jgi:hypothetical protein